MIASLPDASRHLSVLILRLCLRIKVLWTLYTICPNLFLQQQILTLPPTHHLIQFQGTPQPPFTSTTPYFCTCCFLHLVYLSLGSLHGAYSLSLALSLLLLQKLFWFPQAKPDAPLRVSYRFQFIPPVLCTVSHTILWASWGQRWVLSVIVSLVTVAGLVQSECLAHP